MSPKRIAEPLRKLGYDVRAAAEEHMLDSWADDRLLALAYSQGRIFITFNVKDFPRIVGEWASAGQSFAGCVVVVGMGTNEFRLAVERLDEALASRPEQSDWSESTSTRVVAAFDYELAVLTRLSDAAWAYRPPRVCATIEIERSRRVRQRADTICVR